MYLMKEEFAKLVLDATWEVSEDALSLIDKQGFITKVNESFSKLFNIPCSHRTLIVFDELFFDHKWEQLKNNIQGTGLIQEFTLRDHTTRCLNVSLKEVATTRRTTTYLLKLRNI
tara:strand:- start:2968 stop:3312 length:345 start_codon:yes stop_codon:yes gene_type:complete